MMVRIDPRRLAGEAARRERGAWLYLSLTAVLIVMIILALIWWW